MAKAETVTITSRELLANITPALNVLWSLHLEIQGHECRYRPAAEQGINGLIRLMAKIQEGNDGT